MDYTELNIPVKDNEQAEIIMAMLSDMPYDSFIQENGILKAYIPTQELIDSKEATDEILRGMGIEQFRYIAIETQNWNALWESNFQPVVIDKRCIIRAPFHELQEHYDLDIVIMPQMSFGTGHHATTHLMIEAILDLDFEGKSGLDMGSGTGVLSIVAAKRGAVHTDAVDIDDWAFRNCTENIRVNGVEDKITPLLGNVEAIEGKRYDFILANINRNILLADMGQYFETLTPGGMLIMSGFLDEDAEAINSKAVSLGLTNTNIRTRNGWVVLEYIL